MQAFFVQFLCRKNFLSNTVVVCYMKFSLLKVKVVVKKAICVKKKHQITFRSAKKKSENRIIKKEKKRIKKFRTYRRRIHAQVEVFPIFKKSPISVFVVPKMHSVTDVIFSATRKKVVKSGQNLALLEWPLFSINFLISQTFRFRS